jgi:hypothetical protein
MVPVLPVTRILMSVVPSVSWGIRPAMTKKIDVPFSQEEFELECMKRRI